MVAAWMDTQDHACIKAVAHRGAAWPRAGQPVYGSTPWAAGDERLEVGTQARPTTRTVLIR